MSDPVIPFREDTKVYPMLLDLASCMCRELADSGLPDLCFCGVIPGDVSLDYCGNDCGEGGCGGMGWVSLRSMQPALTLNDVPLPRPCMVGQMDVVVEMGIVRCAPMSSTDGTPPDMAAYLDALRLQTADMAALQRAAVCCDLPSVPELSTWISYGPVGGCLGGIWGITIQGV